MTRPLPPVQRRLLPYKDAALYLGISLRSMKSLAAEGHVQKTQIGHRVLFDVRDLDEFIDRVKASA
jgi:excisionase family DNA binding protein